MRAIRKVTSVLALVLFAGVGLEAQAQAPAPPVGAQPAGAQPPAAAPEAAPKMPNIGEDLAAPVYTYEVRGRRDPFRSLLIRKQVERSGIPGIAGMTVDELELQGTIRTKSGWMAMMRGSDNKSYLLRKGSTVFDGEVTEITPSSVTFRQNVNDPTSPKPFRDVVKALAFQQKK
ncbi:MAG: hypothetical protein DIJKHBIC_01018 [Thermoanaerobaculia bacterium]|nr:hypothetical protein [Thermoanaerobaculia bacterium]